MNGGGLHTSTTSVKLQFLKNIFDQPMRMERSNQFIVQDYIQRSCPLWLKFEQAPRVTMESPRDINVDNRNIFFFILILTVLCFISDPGSYIILWDHCLYVHTHMVKIKGFSLDSCVCKSLLYSMCKHNSSVWV